MAIIERAIWETRKRAEKSIFKTLTSSLTFSQKKKLSGSLVAYLFDLTQDLID